MIYAKKRKLKIFHLNGISANFCCFIIGDLSPLLPEPVTFDSKILLLVQYKLSCIRSCLHHSDWRIIFQMLVCSPTKTICEYEYEQYSNLKHTIARMTLRFLFPMKNHGPFFMFFCTTILVKCFAVPTSLFMSVSLPCPIYVHLTPNAVSDDSDHSKQFRRFRYYRILNDVLRTIMMHNTLSFPRQQADFFRVAHSLN